MPFVNAFRPRLDTLLPSQIISTRLRAQPLHSWSTVIPTQTPRLLRLTSTLYAPSSRLKWPATARLRSPSRFFFTDSLPNVLVPPTVFLSLLLGLWTYKCIMTVLFQDRIIYMPYMPPFARYEKIEDYAPICRPVEWSQTHIKSLDSTKLALCIGRVAESRCEEASPHTNSKRVVICYFQGNGSSPPPRMPLLSNTLKAIESRAASDSPFAKYIVIALAYRGYWTSSGRASQRGIEKDTQALLRWVHETYSTPGAELRVILWGQSIGAGIAANAAARYLDSAIEPRLPIAGLILETPFTSIKSMLLALYPQRWLPYQYLSPFLWNHWDNGIALQRVGRAKQRPSILLLPATRDEVVPPSEADKVEQMCLEAGLETQRKDIIGALHTEATSRRDGQIAVADFVVRVTQGR